MAEAVDGAGIPVVVCIAMAPGEVVEVRATVRAGSKVSDVLESPSVRALLERVDDRKLADGTRDGSGGVGRAPDVGIWGRRCPMTQAVDVGDRIEVYRALRVDPMTARRERFRKQGVRATGLFAVSGMRMDDMAS